MKQKIDRIGLIKKYANSKEEPTSEELKSAYGYLDYCFSCGKKFTFWDSITFNIGHGTMGSFHNRCPKKITQLTQKTKEGRE